MPHVVAAAAAANPWFSWQYITENRAEIQTALEQHLRLTVETILIGTAIALPLAMAAFRWRDTIVSQMANSPTVLRLLESASEYLDPAADLDRFYNLIWNVNTAQGYGLDVWGRIVGVSRIINVADTSYFGFKEAPGKPFNFTVLADRLTPDIMRPGNAIRQRATFGRIGETVTTQRDSVQALESNSPQMRH